MSQPQRKPSAPAVVAKANPPKKLETHAEVAQGMSHLPKNSRAILKAPHYPRAPYSYSGPTPPDRDVPPVPMSSANNVHPTWTTHGADIIWTIGLGDCVAIATWNMETCQRSLTHALAGIVTDAWADELARGIDGKTVVIVANGDNTRDPTVFRDMVFHDVKTKIEGAMTRKAARTKTPKAQPQYWMYFTSGVKPAKAPTDLMLGSFMILSDGSFGRTGGPASIAANIQIPEVMLLKEPNPPKDLQNLPAH